MQSNRIEIIVDTTASGDAEVELRRLRQTLDSVRQAQAALQGTTFNAFSRAQIQPQLAGLAELEGRVRKVTTEFEVLNQTTKSPITGVQATINAVSGLDREILSASASARTLATSLSAAANADDSLRQSSMAVAAAQAQILALSERTAAIRRQLTGETTGAAPGFGQLGPVAGQLGQIYAETSAVAAGIKSTLESAFAPPNSLRQTRTMINQLTADIEKATVLARAQSEAAVRGVVESLSRVQSQEIYRSYATGEFMPGQVRSAQAGFLSPDDLATASSMVARMDVLRQAGEKSNNVLRLNRIGFLELQAAGINTMQALASGMNPFHVAVMESTQVLGALIQGGLLPMMSIWQFLINPITAAVAGVAALGAGVAAVVYSMRQANDEFSKAATSAMMQGRPTRLVEENARAMAAQIQASGGLGRVEARTGAVSVQSIPNISAQARTDLQESFEALTRTFEGDATKAAEFLQQTFSSTGAMKSFVDQNVALNDELRRTFNEAVAAGDGLTASAIAAQGLKDRLQPTIDGLRQAREELGWLGRNLDIFGVGFENLLRRQTGQTRLETPTFAPGTQRPTEIDQRAIEATEKQLKAEEDINALLLQRRNIISGIAAATAGTEELSRFAQGQAEVERRLAESHTPIQQEQYNVRIALLERELQQTEQAAAKNPLLWERAAEIRKQLEDEVATHAQGALNRIEGATRRTTDAMIAAAQRTAEARRQMAEAALGQDLFESQFRAAQRPADIYRQLEEAQRRFQAVLAAPANVGTLSQLQSINREILSYQQQIIMAESQANSARLQQAEILAQARGDLAAIVDLRRQEAAIIQGNVARGLAPESQGVQARTQIFQAQVQAQQRAIQLTQQATEQANQFATSRAQTSISALGLEVAQYNMTKTQAIQAEMSLTQTIMEQNQARLRSLLQTQGLTVDQRAQINTQLASLYEEDAQKQIELQTRLTESIRAENERRLSYMKNFFDQVGSSAADVLIAGITRSQTRTEALQGFARSVVSSFIKEASSMASQFAGKGLASLLGVKVDPSGDTGIGTVLSKWIGEAIGLTKDTPKVDQAAISEKMKLAGDTQKTAADLMLQAAQTMAQAAGKGPYAGGAGQPEALRSPTAMQTIQPYKPSAVVQRDPFDPEPTATTKSSIEGAYGVPGAVMNYGRSGALGSVEEASRNLVTITSQSGAAFRVHREAADSFKGFVNELESSGYRIDPSQSGGYSNREMRGGSGASEHAYGTAVDINWSRNPFKSSQTDLPSNVGEMAARHGLIWGGNWTDPKDTMHFQWGGPNAGTRSGGGIETVKVEPLSVSQGVQQGNQNLISQQQELASSSRMDMQATQQSVQATQQDIQQTTQGTQAETSNTEAVRELTASMKQQSQSISGGTKTDGSATGAAGGATSAGISQYDSRNSQGVYDPNKPHLDPAMLRSALLQTAIKFNKDYPNNAWTGIGLGDASQGVSQNMLDIMNRIPNRKLSDNEYELIRLEASRDMMSAGGKTGGEMMYPKIFDNPQMREATQLDINSRIQGLQQEIAKNSQAVNSTTSAFQQNTQQTQNLSSTMGQTAEQQILANSSSTDKNTQSVQQNTQTLQQRGEQTQKCCEQMGGKGGSGGGIGSSGGGSGFGGGQSDFGGGAIDFGGGGEFGFDDFDFEDSDFGFSGGGIIPSAAGGLHVQETSLPAHVRRGIVDLARNNRDLFNSARMTSAMNGPRVRDGKGGQLAIVHPGELILPAEETRIVMGSITSSAEGDFVQMPGSFPPQGGSSSSSSGSSISQAANRTTNSLATLSSAVGVAAGAASLFGSQLSPAAQTIMKVISLMSSLGGLLGGMGGGGGGLGSIFGLATKVFGIFEHGGIVPSAAGGMIVSSMGGGGGQLGILHPREMVLPARLSEGIQNLINTGSYVSERASSTINNSPSFHYESNVSGYHPYESRRQFESMLRNHGDSMSEWVENLLQNGMFRPR